MPEESSDRDTVSVMAITKIYKIPFDFEPDFKREAEANETLYSVHMHYVARAHVPRKYVRIEVSGKLENVSKFIKAMENATLAFE